MKSYVIYNTETNKYYKDRNTEVDFFEDAFETYLEEALRVVYILEKKSSKYINIEESKIYEELKNMENNKYELKSIINTETTSALSNIQLKIKNIITIKQEINELNELLYGNRS